MEEGQLFCMQWPELPIVEGGRRRLPPQGSTWGKGAFTSQLQEIQRLQEENEREKKAGAVGLIAW